MTKHLFKRLARSSALTFCGLILAGTVMAGTVLAGEAQFAGDTLMVKPRQTLTNATLSVTGPNGYYRRERSNYGAPSAALSKQGTLADGIYHWEVRGATSELIPNSKYGQNNGRPAAMQRRFVNKGAVESGTFRVVGGVIIKPSFEIEEAPKGTRAIKSSAIKSHTGQ